MAFEPIETDETLPEKAKREKDMDTQMLMGCSSFVVVSIGSYLLTVWPYFLVAELEKGQTLLNCALMGMVPSLLVGGFASRRFGLPGGFGFVGGAIATAIFLYLRLQATQLAAMAQQLPTPDYPSELIWLLPGAWLFLVMITALALIPKGELPEIGGN
ncbi:MAG: hypothetical protein ACOYON_15275 [Fimbriimonas sp.]